MSEPTHGTSIAESDVNGDDWLTAAAAEPLEATPGESAPPRRAMLVRAGLVAVGAVVGGIAVASMSHGGSTNSTPTAAIGMPQLPGNGQPVPGAAPFAGGLDREQRLAGTLVSVGSSTVTVKTSSGTATYAVTSSSQIVRNGQVVSLSALQPGDAVFVHVYPGGSSSRLVVERIFAGTSADGAPGTRT